VGTPPSGAETLPSTPTRRSAPPRSVTRKPPSGRKARAQGLVRPLATVAIRTSPWALGWLLTPDAVSAPAAASPGADAAPTSTVGWQPASSMAKKGME
jgi:hypothetical protein